MSFPICARFAHPDAGWPADQLVAAEHLVPGEIYYLREVQDAPSRTLLFFREVPSRVGFNSVMFEPVMDGHENGRTGEIRQLAAWLRDSAHDSRHPGQCGCGGMPGGGHAGGCDGRTRAQKRRRLAELVIAHLDELYAADEAEDDGPDHNGPNWEVR